MSIKFLSALLFSFCVATGATAQTSHPNKALNAMVETERAFSRMSEVKGTRESFTEFIAEDGILFRPGPVAGKKWMREHPLPASDKRPLLTWQPNFAGMSRAGDMGYTSGPWQYKSDIKDAKPAAFGDFMTVWQKQPDGRWRFAIDLGVSHPEPKTANATWRPPVLPKSARYRPRKCDSGARDSAAHRTRVFKSFFRTRSRRSFSLVRSK